MFGTKQQFNFTAQFWWWCAVAQPESPRLRVFGLQVPPYFQRQSGHREPRTGIAHVVRRRVLLRLIAAVSTHRRGSLTLSAGQLSSILLWTPRGLIALRQCLACSPAQLAKRVVFHCFKEARTRTTVIGHPLQEAWVRCSAKRGFGQFVDTRIQAAVNT